MSSGITHFFFSWRIFRLTRNVYIFGPLLIFMFTAYGLGVATAVKSFQVNSFASYGQVSDLITAWLSVQAFVDLQITIVLIWIFRHSRTAFASTNAVLNRTGVISSAFSLGYLLAFVLAPDELIWMIFGYCLGRVYSITLMDTLLSRTKLKDKLNGAKSNDNNDVFQLQPSAGQGIRIHTQVQQETDFEPTVLDRKYAGVEEESSHEMHDEDGFASRRKTQMPDRSFSVV
ncbi:hypothetical protein D9758_012297 [Tetrapyrgos nigripes]|uniref:DUF6534 domain-containing protein n=1 Tax=Tetrapyrgos nigripes TaxID=182062 RepID=A0A8H5CGL6_9AGAR|nr:hypothetical protein D9758_012297 [Tetrapyrgos nigripes]